jgi:hypothetical protein
LLYGYLTLPEVDAYLADRLGADAWNANSSVIAKITGQVSATGQTITGVGTLFLTEIDSNTESIYIESIPYQILSIDSDTQITITKSVEIPSPVDIYKYPLTSKAKMIALTTKKIQSILTAHRQVTRILNLSETTTPEDDLKFGTIEWAFWLFSQGDKRQNLVMQGVKKFQIGKFTEEYKDTNTDDKRIGPQEAWNYLQKYINYGTGFDIERYGSLSI